MDQELHDEGTNRRIAQDEIVVAALAAGFSYEEAGQRANLSGRTVARRMADPGFARLVAERRGEHVVATAGRLTTLGAQAMDAIEGCLEDPSARTRLVAAKLVLDLSLKFRNSHDLELEVAEIRQQLRPEG